VSRWIPERPKDRPELISHGRPPDVIMAEMRRKRLEYENSPEYKAKQAEIKECSHRQYVGIIEEMLKRKFVTEDDLRKLIEVG